MIYGILSFVGTARELLDYLVSTQAKIDWQEAINKAGLGLLTDLRAGRGFTRLVASQLKTI